MDVQSLATEAEAGAEPFVEAQGAVGPGPSGAGGDLEGGIAEVPLQQPFAQAPAQGGGRPGLGGAAAAQTLVLLGAGGAQQLWGVRFPCSWRNYRPTCCQEPWLGEASVAPSRRAGGGADGNSIPAQQTV